MYVRNLSLKKKISLKKNPKFFYPTKEKKKPSKAIKTSPGKQSISEPAEQKLSGTSFHALKFRA